MVLSILRKQMQAALEFGGRIFQTLKESCMPNFLPFSSAPTPLPKLATVNGVNTKVTGTTLLYTVPAGRRAIILSAIIRCVTATAITVGPTLSIGQNSPSYNDIYASAVLTGLISTSGTGSSFGFGSIGLFAQGAPGATIDLSITNAATGTSQTISVDLNGYLVSA